MTPPAASSKTSIAELSINTIRFLSIDAVQKANSGHPGLPMGAAPMAYVLWKQFLKHNPKNPGWVDRDRFVLSAGHGSMLLYALLHLTGYDLTMDDLKQFRQLKSRTPGHPENFMTPGVETTTGPLGQGFANGVGMAIAEKMLSARFNRPGFEIVDHYTYGIVSDGDLMEGVSHEAASLAGHYGLGKLIYLYDDNNISIDGSTRLSFTEDVPTRFKGYGWHVVRVSDGNDTDAIAEALTAAREEVDRPSLVVVKTIIGFGSPNLADTAKVHGSPLGEDEVTLTKRNLGWPEDAYFFVPEDVRDHLGEAVERGLQREQDWQSRFEAYRGRFADDAASFERWMSGDLGDEWKDSLPIFDLGSRMATRASSGKVLDAAGQQLLFLVGGSADLSGSNKTFISGREPFQKDRPDGMYFHFGVREHGMAAICNGLVLHGGFRPYCGTFLVFSDYMRPSIRLAALMGLPVIYVFTHDSIGLGEDGPTHQPVEHLMALRAIPNLTVIRPADANEVRAAWITALDNRKGPTALVLTRQSVDTLVSVDEASRGVDRGAYVVAATAGDPVVNLLATGSEVEIAVEAQQLLSKRGIASRVISMPSWERFDAQTEEYKKAVLAPGIPCISIEAGVTLGWRNYVGAGGASVGIDRFGASGPYEDVYEALGITAERVAAVAAGLVV